MTPRRFGWRGVAWILAAWCATLAAAALLEAVL